MEQQQRDRIWHLAHQYQERHEASLIEDFFNEGKQEGLEWLTKTLEFIATHENGNWADFVHQLDLSLFMMRLRSYRSWAAQEEEYVYQRFLERHTCQQCHRIRPEVDHSQDPQEDFCEQCLIEKG